ARADDDRVRPRIGAQHVERPLRGDADAPALAGREAPEARVPSELAPALVEDRPLLRPDAVPEEEAAVVVAGEEAGLLALRAPGHLEAGRRRLRTGLLLRLSAERERDPIQEHRVEPGEHVRLILLGVGRTPEQHAAATTDDAGVVARGEALAAGPVREREQL